MPDPTEQYKYLVVSYMESISSYHSKYRSDDGRSSRFYTVRLYDEDEVKNHIFGLELSEAINNHYTSITFLWYDHYLYTQENTFGPTYDEYDNYIDYDGPQLPESWQKEIIAKVNGDLGRRQTEKEAARLAKAQEAVIMKEQEERREYEKLSKKYGGFQNI